jgi:hypothetical protein
MEPLEQCCSETSWQPTTATACSTGDRCENKSSLGACIPKSSGPSASAVDLLSSPSLAMRRHRCNSLHVRMCVHKSLPRCSNRCRSCTHGDNTQYRVNVGISWYASHKLIKTQAKSVRPLDHWDNKNCARLNDSRQQFIMILHETAARHHYDEQSSFTSSKTNSDGGTAMMAAQIARPLLEDRTWARATRQTTTRMTPDDTQFEGHIPNSASTRMLLQALPTIRLATRCRHLKAHSVL